MTGDRLNERVDRLEAALAKFAEGVAKDPWLDQRTRRLGRDLLADLQGIRPVDGEGGTGGSRET